MGWKVPGGLSKCGCPCCGDLVVVFGRCLEVVVVLDSDGDEHACWSLLRSESRRLYARDIRAAGTMYDILLLKSFNNGLGFESEAQLDLDLD